MSQSSGFGPNPYDPSSTGGANWGASPYAPGAQQPGYPPPRRSWGCGWILLLLAIFAGVPLLCCGACGGFVWLGFEVVEDEIADDLKTEPIIREHLGEVESVEFNVWESIREEMRNPTDDDEDSFFVFDVRGSKGSGVVIGRSVTNEDDLEELRDGRLKLPDGQEFKLSK